ncbi:unnamed protein product [Prorocentrum cordatum]|uniref:Uncharacterized protein n=1 Tax=Prorocentrum cordatum TaxID=2364126 RepID=A0ABN9S1V2_9DINO|nr:unnamed protein product [Polarella glacialis]
MRPKTWTEIAFALLPTTQFPLQLEILRNRVLTGILLEAGSPFVVTSWGLKRRPQEASLETMEERGGPKDAKGVAAFKGDKSGNGKRGNPSKQASKAKTQGRRRRQENKSQEPPRGPHQRGGGSSSDHADCATAISSLQKLALRTALVAREQQHLLSELWLIPTSRSPFKAGAREGLEHAVRLREAGEKHKLGPPTRPRRSCYDREIKNCLTETMKQGVPDRALERGHEALAHWLDLAHHERGMEFVTETLKMFKIAEAGGRREGQGELLYSIEPLPSIRAAMRVERIAKMTRGAEATGHGPGAGIERAAERQLQSQNKSK